MADLRQYLDPSEFEQEDLTNDLIRKVIKKLSLPGGGPLSTLQAGQDQSEQDGQFGFTDNQKALGGFLKGLF